jgi:hypothetical protein
MPAAGNFTTVTLGPDNFGKRKLRVNGISRKPDKVQAIYVSVARMGARGAPLGAGQPGDRARELRSAAVKGPEGAGGWTAFLNQASPAYKVGEKLLVVGVIVDKGGIPSFWHQMKEIAPG